VTSLVLPISFVEVSVNITLVPLCIEYTVPALKFVPFLITKSKNAASYVADAIVAITLVAPVSTSRFS
jgi:hypothetical protein